MIVNDGILKNRRLKKFRNLVEYFVSKLVWLYVIYVLEVFVP